MDSRFIPTEVGQFSVVPWSGRNESGIRALCDKVLVLPDQAPDMTEGGIWLPDTVKDTLGLAATTGVLVSVGPLAFVYDSHRMARWEGEKPEPGSRIFFQKYAGQTYTGRDGLLYRLMEYGAIAGVEEEPEMKEAAKAA